MVTKNAIKDIVDSTLSKERLNDDVLSKIASSDKNKLPFISKESKNVLKEYIKERHFDSDHTVAKNVWKNLLIDAITILKINDSREIIYNDTQNDLNKFIENFSLIRKSSSYGIDELDSYFDDFIKFESVLYGMDSHYRDHVDHVLQVWAMGVSLLTHYDFISNDIYNIKKDINFNFDLIVEGEEKGLEKEKIISKSELWSMWTIIALCHDLGYPIEKASQINSQAKKIITHFGNMQFTELDYNFNIFNTFLLDKFLNVISSKARIEEQNEDKYLCHMSIQPKYKDKFSKSLEEYKHGIFSSLLLFKNLTYFLETDYQSDKKEMNLEDIRQFFIRKEILRAISGHTCPRVYHIKLNTLPFLLILCDELQEWNRPNLDYRIEKKILDDNLEVKISEFEITSEKQVIHIEFKYKFESNDTHIKYLVKKKFKNIHNLLRGAKDDRKRTGIKFQWDIEFTNEIYYFIFDTQDETKDSFNLLTTEVSSINSDGEIGIHKEPFNLYDK